MSPPNTIPTRELGKGGPQVPCVGYGLMELSVSFLLNTPPDEERLEILDRAWELGETFWDTAAGYGDNEMLLGKWFKLHPERRQDIFLATKFGMSAKFDENGKISMAYDSSPENCRASCERSLSKLGVDCVDLFYVHRFDTVTPVEKTMEALVELKREGKIRCIGFSGCSSNTIRRGCAVHSISAVEVEFSPWSLDIEKNGIMNTCKELGVAIVTYSPLARGVLTGRYKSLDDLDAKDTRRQLPRFSPENFSKNLVLVQIFEKLAQQKGCTPAQVVLAWIMAQGSNMFPIPGTRTLKYLEQNVGAVNITISPDEDKYIRETIEAMGGVAGGRNYHGSNEFAETVPL